MSYELTEYQNTLEVLSTNVFFADKDLNLIYLNNKARKTMNMISEEVQSEFGLSVEDLVGQNLDSFHGNRAQEIRKILKNPRNFPYRAEIEFAGLVLDLNINTVYDETQELVGYVVNWEEISEKKKAEKAAARAESMLEQSPVNTMMADLDCQLIYMNDSSKKTLRQIENVLPDKVDNLVGQSIDIFHKDPGRIRRLLPDSKNLPHKAKIQVGEDKLDLLVSPVKDEKGRYIGPMVTWELITDRLKLVEDLTESADDLTGAAEELLTVANNLASMAEETSSQATTASSASEEVTAGVQTVATNMEEMAASIKEITKSTNESSNMSDNAMKMATSANEIITKLGDSSMDIGNVIKVISSIAQQTNLLALNATIEAARAGEAGKGFAVVANEVKELAKQTAKATEDITKKIETIQSDSNSAVSAIGEVSQAIEKLNNIAGSIAASIEEQAATTTEVSRVVQESADSVKSISENIQQVSEASAETGKGASATQDSAKKLGGMAEKLRALVSRVKI